MIVRNITCDKDLNRKLRKRSRSLDDGHLLPAQGTTAADHTAFPGGSFTDAAVGREVPLCFVKRGTSDVSGILKRWRVSAAQALPHPSSTPLVISLPQPSSSTNTPTFSRKSISNMDLGKGLHVLVVDDDILTRKLMERSLGRMGCAVDTAENGQMALEMIASANQVRSNWSRYDIVFLDNQMVCPFA